MEKAWSAVYAFCKEYSVQIFASTHSMENLESLVPLLQADKEYFRLIRLESGNEGNHTARMLSGDEFLATLETGLDPR